MMAVEDIRVNYLMSVTMQCALLACIYAVFFSVTVMKFTGNKLSGA